MRGDRVRGWRRCAGAHLLALALAGATVRAQAGATGSRVDPVYIPAGVSDSGGTVGCLRTPDGGVETIDLATGRSLWRSAAPARALLVARDQAFLLEARSGGPRLAVYAARTGKPSREYDLAALALPPWASLAEPSGGREWTVFQAEAHLEADTLEIRIDAIRRQISGMAPPGVVAEIRGIARLALGSGRVTWREGPGPSRPPIAARAPALKGVRALSIHARSPDGTIVRGGPPPNIDGALVEGSRRSVFELSRDTTVVTVHRWTESGRSRLPPLRLEHGHRTDAVWATLERRHVLLRRADDQRLYDLYSLETGSLVGTLEGPVDVAVAGRRICWTAGAAGGGLEIRGTDLASGRLAWRRTVLEPEGDPGPPIP